MATTIPLKLVTSPSNAVARIDGDATGGTDTIEPSLILGLVADGAVVGTAKTQTLTNKTLTAPTIDEVFVSGARAHKFLAGGDNYIISRGQAAGGSPQVGVDGSDANINLALVTKGTGVPVIRYGGAGAIAVADVSSVQTLSNKTLTLPLIADFTASNHDHEDGPGGGTLDARFCFTPGAGTAALFSATQASDTTNVGASSVAFQAITATTPTIPADALTNTVTFEIKITGKYTTDGAARTVQFVVSRDGTNHYFATAAITLGNALTDQRFQLEFQMTCTATGVSGVMRSQITRGYVQGASAPAPATILISAPQTLTIDTGADNNIVIGAIRDAGSGAGNTITIETYTVTKLN